MAFAGYTIFFALDFSLFVKGLKFISFLCLPRRSGGSYWGALVAELLPFNFRHFRYAVGLNLCKRSQVPGSTFRVRDKDKIEDPKSS